MALHHCSEDDSVTESESTEHIDNEVCSSPRFQNSRASYSTPFKGASICHVNSETYDDLTQLPSVSPISNQLSDACRTPRETRSADMLSQSFTYGCNTFSPDAMSQSYTFGAMSGHRGSTKAGMAKQARLHLHRIRGPRMDLNATFPAPKRNPKMRVNGERGMHKLRGQGMDTLSFATAIFDNHENIGNGDGDLDASLQQQDWGMRSLNGQFPGAQSRNVALAHGPTKAVVTINSDGIILVANQRACTLFGFKPSDIVGTKLSQLLPKSAVSTGKVVSDLFINAHGGIERVNGRVVDACDHNGTLFPVSLFLTKVDANDAGQEKSNGSAVSHTHSATSRYLVVMEPVARTTAVFGLDTSGCFVWCDATYVALCGKPECDVRGQSLASLVPSMTRAEPLRGTTSTDERRVSPSGVLLEGSSPSPASGAAGGQCSGVYYVTTRGQDASSTIPATLVLEGTDAHGASLLSEQGLSARLVSATAQVGTLHVYTNISGLITCKDDGTVYGCNENFVLLLFGYTETQLVGQHVSKILPDFTTDALHKGGASAAADGNMRVYGQHHNGTLIEVTYEVKKVVDTDLRAYWCIWVSRQTTPHDTAVGQDEADAQAACVTVDTDVPPPELTDERRAEVALSAADLRSGEFGKHYTVGATLGTGSFGSVFEATSKATGDTVVVKFIRSDRVLSECWDIAPTDLEWASRMLTLCYEFEDVVQDQSSNGNTVDLLPREIVLLMQLQHAHIGRALEVFRTEQYYQLVLEHNGSGFDLFQFIDESSEVHEDVAAYILRQVASALEYLHALHIVHRDIKDENVVLNHALHAKLIDFGSAAYAAPDRLFDTFCGTLEYCAPEVLLGNPYAGYELDMFALGVTLYTMVFAERPFFDVEETIAGVLSPPSDVSPSCADVILLLLTPNPVERGTATEVLAHPWCNRDVSKRVADATSILALEQQVARGKVTPTAGSGTNTFNRLRLTSESDEDADDDDFDTSVYNRLE
eukprot:m.479571 g.479571  ORF g.479571 m.479571 type:complete len:988 (+) comp21702_c0_seq1:270-3233(+)